MKISVIKEKMRGLKKFYGKLETNFYPGMASDNQEAEIYENEKALVFIVPEPNRRRAFFAFAEETALKELLLKIPEGTITEYIHKTQKNPLEEIFTESNMEQYALYIRSTLCYCANPFTIPETGRRKLLMEMYDPSCGEYAKKDDIAEFDQLTRETFDILCDDVFTIEQWEEIISRQECLCYRENGKIITFYVFRLEGKKLYSNMSLNRGPANYLYNLERRIFEEMYNKGIRIFYAWYNSKNNKALKRGNKNANNAVKSEEIIYNQVFIKK